MFFSLAACDLDGGFFIEVDQVKLRLFPARCVVNEVETICGKAGILFVARAICELLLFTRL